MEMSIPSIFIVGSSSVGKKTLTLRITGSAPDQEASGSWRIDTKYYTAHARIEFIKCTSDTIQNSTCPDCEALILLVDAQREETYRDVKEWLAHQAISPEVTLFVSNKSELLRSADGSVQRQSWHEEAQDWCCQQLFEYIEVSAADEAADQSLLLDGDPQGVKRVLEALEAHTWPGLQLKATQDGASSNGGPHVHAARGEDPSTSGEGSSVAAENSTYRQYWARAGEDDRTLGSDQEPGEPLRAQQEEPLDRPALSASPEEMNGAHGNQNGHNGVAEPGDGASEDEDEDELDNFERMLGRMSAVRQQLQGIPDDERRARAAAMAMQMMHSLGLDDDDHNDTSDSE
ncbi:probable alpha- and gamma-adaptin-binding protein p34 [Coccomyxa sp. Obi]|nr:probable alpha- and gamma-adaptin-binding protein p34 [Coccomyxa sp. Obi]